MKLKALLVGGGAREHAIAKRLSESSELSVAMKHKNPGIARIAKSILLESETNVDSVVAFALKEKADFAVVGLEAPLEKGLANVLEAKGIPCVGASQKAALLETNKLFCRQFMRDNGIDCIPDFFVFDEAGEAQEFLRGMEKAVVKPVGLTGGKGVKVMGEQVSKQEALDYAKALVEKDGTVLIEDFLEGEEFSLQAFVSGDAVVEMPLAQDHKRAFEGDQGPNTGGMGSYSDANHLLPFVTLEEKNQALNAMRQTVKALKKSGVEYKGVLYGQFMLTKHGPKLVEYNARFGDPEAMNVLPLLEGDFTRLCWKMIDGKLSPGDAVFENKATVVKYAVPEGYPDHPAKGAEITVDESKINSLGGQVFYAIVSEENGRLLMGGSRAVAILGKGDSIAEAEGVAQKAIETVKGKIFYRKDIGTNALVQKRIEHMRGIRG
ncbi:MAG: phosphoribosylamine--glycine ligase [Candidatus Norongarragalinales archaeon]